MKFNYWYILAIIVTLLVLPISLVFILLGSLRRLSESGYDCGYEITDNLLKTVMRKGTRE